MKKTFLSLLVGFSVATQVHADDLYQVYQQALKNDPTTLQALAQKEAANSDIKTSRGSLLPQLSLDGNWTETRGDSTSKSFTVGDNALTSYPAGTPIGSYDSDVDSTSKSLELNLTQVIYNRATWVALDRAEKVASQYNTQYEQVKQELIVRVVSAYFDVLQAQDDLAFAKAEKRAIERQLEQTKQRFEVGLTAITDVHEAQAQYDTAVASEISAENNVEITKEALREITGEYPQNVSILDTEKFAASAPFPAKVEDWLTTAETQNLSLRVASASVDIAKDDIENARSGHYPKVSLSASIGRSKADSFSSTYDANTGSTTDSYSAGINVSIPLYNGGSVTSATESARHSFVATSEAREKTRRTVIRDVRSNFYDVSAAISQIKAFEQAVISAESALKATEAGFEVGTRTIVDVLNSTQNLYDAKRNLSSARYGYVNSMLSLKQAAGSLNENDLQGINKGLKAAM